MINLLFFTVTVTKNKKIPEEVAEEALQYEKIKRIREENYVKAIQHGYFM